MESSALAAIRALEELGYVTRERREGNRKNYYVTLTRSGHSLKKKLVPLAEEVNLVAAKGLSEGDLAITRRSLLIMLDNLAGDADGPAAGDEEA